LTQKNNYNLKNIIKTYELTTIKKKSGWSYLPKLIISPKRIIEDNIVIMRASGVDMARNTGPFFSITHVIK
jgi:hypothetical protein